MQKSDVFFTFKVFSNNFYHIVLYNFFFTKLNHGWFSFIFFDKNVQVSI